VASLKKLTFLTICELHFCGVVIVRTYSICFLQSGDKQVWLGIYGVWEQTPKYSSWKKKNIIPRLVRTSVYISPSGNHQISACTSACNVTYRMKRASAIEISFRRAFRDKLANDKVFLLKPLFPIYQRSQLVSTKAFEGIEWPIQILRQHVAVKAPAC